MRTSNPLLTRLALKTMKPRNLVSSCISLRDTEKRFSPPGLGAKRSNSTAIASICNDIPWDAKRFECSRTYATRH